MNSLMLELITTVMETEIETTTTVEPLSLEPQINGKELTLLKTCMVLQSFSCNFRRHLHTTRVLYIFIILYFAILSDKRIDIDNF